MLYLGFTQQNSEQYEEAVKTLEEARETYRSIDGLKLADLPSAAAYAEATSWQVSAFQSMGRHDDARSVGEQGAQVAGQVLDKRPGHMGAIRSRALISNSLADAELDSLHLRKAIALYEASERDWEAILKIDPTNQIAVNNLANARLSAAFALQRSGRIIDSQQEWRAALAIEKQARPSAMISSTLSIPAGALAALEADLGNRSAAEAALAEYTRLNELAIRELPPDSFGRAAIGTFGFFGIGVFARHSLPIAAGDYATVHKMAEATAQRGEALTAKIAAQEFVKNRGIAATYLVLADASYNLKDYAAADKEIKRALDTWRRVPKRTLQEERDASDVQILAAMIAARQENYSEAQQIIAPVVKFHRGLYARGNDDLGQHVQLAQALYVSALAAASQKTSAQLTEAAVILDRLPPAMRRQISVTLWRDRIAEEQKKRR